MAQVLGLGLGVGVGVDCVPTPRAPKWSPPLHQDVFDDRHRAPPFARALPGRNVDCLRPPNPWAKNRRKRYRMINFKCASEVLTAIEPLITLMHIGWKIPLNMMKRYVFDPCRTSSKRQVFKTRIHNTTRAVRILRTSLAKLATFLQAPKKWNGSANEAPDLAKHFSNPLHEGQSPVFRNAHGFTNKFHGTSKMTPQKTIWRCEANFRNPQKSAKFSLSISGKTKPLELGKTWRKTHDVLNVIGPPPQRLRPSKRFANLEPAMISRRNDRLD